MRATGSHHLDRHSFQGNRVAGLDYRVIDSLPQRRICVEPLGGGGRGAAAGLCRELYVPVVNDVSNRYPRRERGHVADVIAIEMRDDEVIDLREPRLLHGIDDDVGRGLAGCRLRPADVDEHRLS
jgi:hypothetical protein